MGQVADQRQCDRGHAGAQPVMGGLAQVGDHKPQPRGQPRHAGGQQQFQVLVVGGVKGAHPLGDVRARPLGHSRVHHAGADAEQLAPHRLRQPAFGGDAPGRAAVGAPVIVKNQQVIQAAQAGEARHKIGKQRQHCRAEHNDHCQCPAQLVQRQFPPAQGKPQHGPDCQTDREPELRHMTQRRQHWLTALGVDMGAHILHPPGVEEEKRPDDRQPPQRAGGEVFLADEHQHRRADAQSQALSIHHSQR